MMQKCQKIHVCGRFGRFYRRRHIGEGAKNAREMPILSIQI